MLSRAQMIVLFFTIGLLLLLYALPHTPLSLVSMSTSNTSCPSFDPLTSLSQLPELAKGRQCGHVATLNALYRWELNPIDEN